MSTNGHLLSKKVGTLVFPAAGSKLILLIVNLESQFRFGEWCYPLIHPSPILMFVMFREKLTLSCLHRQRRFTCRFSCLQSGWPASLFCSNIPQKKKIHSDSSAHPPLQLQGVSRVIGAVITRGHAPSSKLRFAIWIDINICWVLSFLTSVDWLDQVQDRWFLFRCASGFLYLRFVFGSRCFV